jgi:putative two-component system response regulator
MLEIEGYMTASAADGEAGLHMARHSKPDLILCDVIMPTLNGYEVLTALRQDPGLADIPLIFLTAKSRADDIQHGIELGADAYITKPFSIRELTQAIGARLRHNYNRPSAECDINAQAYQHIPTQLLHPDRATSANDLVIDWARLLETRGIEEAGHAERVASLTVRLARAMGIDGAELVNLRRGAMLHDIGKLGVPDSILRKAGPLDESEWLVMRQHPACGHQLLTSIPTLQEYGDIPYAHHEWWNGGGYPRGLQERQIPFSARLFAVIDVWDALRAERPYRHRWPEHEVRAYIESEAGAHFDPEVVKAFLTADLL